jgi:hypothetical protein
MNGPEKDKTPKRKLRSPGKFGLALIILTLIWLGWFTFRWDIRGYWHAFRLTQAESLAQQKYYCNQLAALYGSGETLAGIDMLLNSSRPEIRVMGVETLDKYPGREALPLLQKMLQDENRRVMLTAAIALSRRYISRTRPSVSTRPSSESRPRIDQRTQPEPLLPH